MFPALAELRNENDRLYHRCKNIVKSLTTMQATLQELLTPLEQVKPPNGSATPVTILKLDQPTIDRGVDALANIRSLLSSSEDILYEPNLHTIPTLPSMHMEIYELDIFCHLIPMLSTGQPFHNSLGPQG